MKRLATILLVTALTASAAISSAAYSAYMTVTGARQGAFKGAGRSKVNKIPVVQFTMSDVKASNARNQPIELDVEIDGIDVVEFENAFATNENLTVVTLQVVESVNLTQVKNIETIKLTNATIKTLVQSFKSGSAPTQTMHLTAQRVEVSQSNGSIQSSDDWESRV